jgi:hypothetical protein
LFEVGYVYFDGEGFAARGRNFRCQGGELFFIARGYGYSCAGFGESKRGVTANALGGSGYQRDFVFQTKHSICGTDF